MTGAVFFLKNKKKTSLWKMTMRSDVVRLISSRKKKKKKKLERGSTPL